MFDGSLSDKVVKPIDGLIEIKKTKCIDGKKHSWKQNRNKSREWDICRKCGQEIFWK